MGKRAIFSWLRSAILPLGRSCKVRSVIRVYPMKLLNFFQGQGYIDTLYDTLYICIYIDTSFYIIHISIPMYNICTLSVYIYIFSILYTLYIYTDLCAPCEISPCIRLFLAEHDEKTYRWWRNSWRGWNGGWEVWRRCAMVIDMLWQMVID